jgi:hypothetical protein
MALMARRCYPRRRRRAKRLALGALAAAGLAMTVPGCGSEAGQQSPAAAPSGFFGINANQLPALAVDRQTELDAHLSSIQALGIGFVRAGIDWRGIEPAAPVAGQHSYDFAATDAWVEALAQHDLRWMPVATIPPPQWAVAPATLARCGIHAPPSSSSDLGDLMGAVAARYGRSGKFWKAHPELPYRPVTDYEVWNEENHGAFWCPRPDPSAYADLYAASEGEIRQVDPAARVVLGGLAAFRPGQRPPSNAPRMTPPAFLAQVLAARPELRVAVDVVGVHSYEPTPVGVLDDLRWYRDTLRQLGMGQVPMSLDETGWYTHGSGSFGPTPEIVRASYYLELTSDVARSDCGVVSIAPYTWISAQTGESPQAWYGIADPATGAPYPSAQAYGAGIKVPEGKASEAPQAPQSVCGEPPN